VERVGKEVVVLERPRLPSQRHRRPLALRRLRLSTYPAAAGKTGPGRRSRRRGRPAEHPDGGAVTTRAAATSQRRRRHRSRFQTRVLKRARRRTRVTTPTDVCVAAKRTRFRDYTSSFQSSRQTGREAS